MEQTYCIPSEAWHAMFCNPPLNFVPFYFLLFGWFCLSCPAHFFPGGVRDILQRACLRLYPTPSEAPPLLLMATLRARICYIATETLWLSEI